MIPQHRPVLSRWLVVLALFHAGCSPAITEPTSARATTSSAPPSPSLPPAREPPPESGPAPRVSFPRIVDQSLENGMQIRTVERRGLPLVELELTVLSGTETDGERVGLSTVSASLLKDGGAGPWNSRQLVEQAESLGATLQVFSAYDRTVLSLAVPTQHLPEAIDILATVARRPRFDPREFAKLKQREIERVTSAAKTSGAWAAAMVLYRELYRLPTSRHPYAVYDATPTELERVGLDDCRRWHRAHFVPQNAVLVAAGAVTPDTVAAEVKRAFGTWKGERPEPPTFAPPLPPPSLEIYVVDRPESPQSDIFVGLLGPERRAEEWPALDVANQVLGGGVAGRLFLDVREQRSLAYSTGSRLRSLARSRVPIVLSAGTRTEQAAETLGALLDHVDRLGRELVSEGELESARRYLADSMLINTETVDALASLSGSLVVLGLPPDYYDNYRSQLLEVSAEAVLQTTRRFFTRNKAIAVVAGAASTLAPALSHLAPVVVIDPENGFTVKRREALRPAGEPATQPEAPVGPK